MLRLGGRPNDVNIMAPSLAWAPERSYHAPMNASDNPHLLVVDDDERLRSLLQRYLSANGFRVTAAADAAEARALMKSIAFDGLILDVMMPGETGLDLASDLRAQVRRADPDADGARRSAKTASPDWNAAPTIICPSRSSRASCCCGVRALLRRARGSGRRRIARCTWATACSIPNAAS